MIVHVFPSQGPVGPDGPRGDDGLRGVKVPYVHTYATVPTPRMYTRMPLCLPSYVRMCVVIHTHVIALVDMYLNI